MMTLRPRRVKGGRPTGYQTFTQEHKSHALAISWGTNLVLVKLRSVLLAFLSSCRCLLEMAIASWKMPFESKPNNKKHVRDASHARSANLVGTYSALLRYYRCNAPYCAMLFLREVSTRPKAHLCNTPFCNIFRDNCAIPHKNKHEEVFRYYRCKCCAI